MKSSTTRTLVRGVRASWRNNTIRGQSQLQALVGSDTAANNKTLLLRKLSGTARCFSNWSSALSTRHLLPPRRTPHRHFIHMSPNDRLSLISRHFDHSSAHDVPLNTPFSIERESSRIVDDFDKNPFKDSQQKRSFSTQSPLQQEGKKATNMSKQAPHPTLLIPGPIEFDDEVLQSMSHYSEAHVGQAFVNVFGETLTMLRKVLLTQNPKSQPFIISGSGTLGWDQVAANLTEPGDEALVLHTGYFANSFADCFETYGVKATQIKAPIGDRPQLPEIEKALKEKKYKVITVTHTDTSTGVLSEIKPLTELVRKVSPETLVVVDGVCSVGCEELRFDEWDVDFVLTGSQKALGCPAGLSITMASERAMEAFKARKSPPGSYFASFKNWTPIMQNYEAKKPSYFATPSPQLIHALHTSLKQILTKSMEQRFEDHKRVSDKIKKYVSELGLKQLAAKPENQAHGMTAIYLPDGLTPPEILPSLLKKDIIFAGGLHKEIATKYIRFGHMGVSVTDTQRDDIDRALKALKDSLVEVGYKVPN